MKLARVFAAMAITVSSVLYAMPVSGGPNLMPLERTDNTQVVSYIEKRALTEGPSEITSVGKVGDQLTDLKVGETSKDAEELEAGAKGLLKLNEPILEYDKNGKLLPSFSHKTIPNTPEAVKLKLQEIYRLKDQYLASDGGDPITWQRFLADSSEIKNHEQYYAGRALHEKDPEQQVRSKNEEDARKEMESVAEATGLTANRSATAKEKKKKQSILDLLRGTSSGAKKAFSKAFGRNSSKDEQSGAKSSEGTSA